MGTPGSMEPALNLNCELLRAVVCGDGLATVKSLVLKGADVTLKHTRRDISVCCDLMTGEDQELSPLDAALKHDNVPLLQVMSSSV